MSNDTSDPSRVWDVLELRRSFRRTFSAPIAELAATDDDDLLELRLAGDPYAVRVAEVSGLIRATKVTRLPSRCPAVLGLSGIRGSVVPVYSIPSILGYPLGDRPLAWFLLCGTRAPIALAVDGFDGYRTSTKANVRPLPAVATARAHVIGTVSDGAETRLVLNVPSLLGAIDEYGHALGDGAGDRPPNRTGR